jgi:hypothetical protein
MEAGGSFGDGIIPIVLTSMKAGLIPKRVRIGASIHCVGGGGDARHGPVACMPRTLGWGLLRPGSCEEIDWDGPDEELLLTGGCG